VFPWLVEKLLFVFHCLFFTAQAAFLIYNMLNAPF